MLIGLGSLFAAPAVVKADNLMPIFTPKNWGCYEIALIDGVPHWFKTKGYDILNRHRKYLAVPKCPDNNATHGYIGDCLAKLNDDDRVSFEYTKTYNHGVLTNILKSKERLSSFSYKSVNISTASQFKHIHLE